MSGPQTMRELAKSHERWWSENKGDPVYCCWRGKQPPAELQPFRKEIAYLHTHDVIVTKLKLGSDKQDTKTKSGVFAQLTVLLPKKTAQWLIAALDLRSIHDNAQAKTVSNDFEDATSGNFAPTFVLHKIIDTRRIYCTYPDVSEWNQFYEFCMQHNHALWTEATSSFTFLHIADTVMSKDRLVHLLYRCLRDADTDEKINKHKSEKYYKPALESIEIEQNINNILAIVPGLDRSMFSQMTLQQMQQMYRELKTFEEERNQHDQQQQLEQFQKQENENTTMTQEHQTEISHTVDEKNFEDEQQNQHEQQHIDQQTQEQEEQEQEGMQSVPSEGAGMSHDPENGTPSIQHQTEETELQLPLSPLSQIKESSAVSSITDQDSPSAAENHHISNPSATHAQQQQQQQQQQQPAKHKETQQLVVPAQTTQERKGVAASTSSLPEPKTVRTTVSSGAVAATTTTTNKQTTPTVQPMATNSLSMLSNLVKTVNAVTPIRSSATTAPSKMANVPQQPPPVTAAVRPAVATTSSAAGTSAAIASNNNNKTPAPASAGLSRVAPTPRFSTSQIFTFPSSAPPSK